MKVQQTSLKGVLLITPPTVFEDHRGVYVESYNAKQYREAGIDVEFVQDCMSVSHKYVLRGIHGDDHTTKLVSCPVGDIYLVVINNDTDSPQFGEHVPFRLSETNHLQVLVPPKHGVGHLVLTSMAAFAYKQSSTYDPASQWTIPWNTVPWPISNPILSERDRGLPA